MLLSGGFTTYVTMTVLLAHIDMFKGTAQLDELTVINLIPLTTQWGAPHGTSPVLPLSVAGL